MTWVVPINLQIVDLRVNYTIGYPHQDFFVINVTAEYALRAVVYLACSDRVAVSRDRIAQDTKIPTDYLVRVLMSLDSAGVVISQRGRGGGYRLNREVEELTVYDVIAAVSALPRIDKCPLGIAEHINLCPLHARLDEVAALADAAYRATTISELIPHAPKKKQGCSFPHHEPK